MTDDGFIGGGRIALAGSERSAPAGSHRIGAAPADEHVEVMVVVRRRAALPPPSAAPVARADFGGRFGADPADLALVARFATEAGLFLVESDAARRTVLLEGTVALAQAAFGVALSQCEVAGTSYRGREGALHLPAALDGVVMAVLGLDTRPQAHFRAKHGAPIHPDALPDPSADPWPVADPGPAPSVVFARADVKPLWASQVAELYQFPYGYDGRGQTIAIVELGGGYTATDVRAYFAKAKIRAPRVTAVPVGTGTNAPTGDPAGPDGEVLLDIEVAGSVAPGAQLAVYFADPSDAGFLQAVTTAIHDRANAPSVLSISWGAPESQWTAQALRAFDEAFADAAALGITVLAAAGDHGAGDGAGDGQRHADFPASSPNVVGCGGTTLTGTGGHTVSEIVWNDQDGWATGGGISSAFAPPTWQAGIPAPRVAADGGPPVTAAPGRGVPDVAGNADITSGYLTLTDGQWSPAGGTSAVAPLYAGLVARCNQALGHPLGAANPTLYAAHAHPSAAAFRDVLSGDNSVPATSDFGPATTGYAAVSGWDACTGLGSIHGEALLKLLQAGLEARRRPSP